MDDRHAERRQRLEEAVLRGPGHSEPSLRQAAATQSAALPAELAALVDKVHRHAYKVTDEEVAALRARYSDDQLFEIVVSAALGAARHQLSAGWRALEEA